MLKKSRVLMMAFLFFSFLFTSPVFANDGNKDNSLTEKKESASKQVLFENHITDVYQSIVFGESRPDYELFRKAYVGFLNLKAANKLSDKNILTIIDFRLSSTKERFWSIDLAEKKVLFHSLVAHGRRSGEEFAKKFSNTLESHMSSFGFYVTGSTYTGKHGLSLYLDGMDAGYNSNARTRAIVMHSADYVNKEFINQFGRLGRSLGCPAIPAENHEEVINTLMDKTCLFIYYPNTAYEKKAKLLSNTAALNYFFANQLAGNALSTL
jgi:hypothetical protein